MIRPMHIARQALTTLLPSIVAATVLLMPAGVAHAAEGVILITQDKAEAGGVSPADAAGLPVTLSAPGSYRLAGNLATADAAATIIEIRSSDVTLDMNGFQIAGPAVCTGEPASCTGTGSGIGIRVHAGYRGVTIRNGNVRGMGGHGISQDASSSGSEALALEGIKAVGNGGTGIAAGNKAIVRRCIASRNGGAGISGLDGVRVEDSVVYANGGEGLTFTTRASVNGVVAAASGAAGAALGDGSSISGAVVHGNAAGMSAGEGSQVRYTAVTDNAAQGVVAGGGAKIEASVISGNTGVGLEADAATAYELNVIAGNDSGGASTQVSGGVETGTNLCGGNTTCP